MRMCDCSLSYTNTGVPNCKAIMAVAKRIILVPTYDATGTRNKIGANDSLDATYFSNLINQADPTKRWYPLPEIVNVEDVRGEPMMETLADGKKVFIQDGVRSFKAWMIKQPVELKAKLDQWRCLGMSAFFVDKEGNLIGSTDGTDFYPIIIDNDTLYVALVKTTDTTVQKLQMTFEFASSEDDGDLKMITETEMGDDALLWEGLLDVNFSTPSSVSLTGFVVDLTFDYGTFSTPQVATGFVKADFILYNNTDDPSHAAPITITTTTENPDGTYTFVIPAQTGLDELELTGSHDGYEFDSVVFTLPAS